MIRAAFFACGFFVTLCGVLATCVDRVVLTDYASRRLRQAVRQSEATDSGGWRLLSTTDAGGAAGDARQVVDPPDWAGFALLSVGGVQMLYSLCLPRAKAEDDDEE